MELNPGKTYRLSYPEGDHYQVIAMSILRPGIIRLADCYTDAQGVRHPVYIDDALVRAGNVQDMIKRVLHCEPTTELTVQEEDKGALNAG